MKFFNHKKTISSFPRKTGFTLVEMMVAVFVFSVVMVLSTGAIFSIISANKTSQALKSVMDNLTSALDSMSREIRYGTVYSCDSDPYFITPSSCGDDATNEIFSFVGRPTTEYPNGAKIKYYFDNSGIYKKTEADSSSNPSQPEKDVRLTAQEVVITNLHFYVVGAEKNESQQPQVLVTVSGYALAGTNKSNFNIETMVSQRTLTCKQSVENYLGSGVNCP
jgi:prepilin-type N-terminal cleavage/methylation domain-containing protein